MLDLAIFYSFLSDQNLNLCFHLLFFVIKTPRRKYRSFSRLILFSMIIIRFYYFTMKLRYEQNSFLELLLVKMCQPLIKFFQRFLYLLIMLISLFLNFFILIDELVQFNRQLIYLILPLQRFFCILLVMRQYFVFEILS